MRFIEEHGMRHAMERAWASLDTRTHLDVSFDVDFLDLGIAPGVGTTVPGAAELAVDLIESLFGKSTLMRQP